MSVNLSTNFEQFLENISLGDPQVPRMNSAWRTVSEFLVASYGMPQQDTFLQGSYANGTAIEPVNDGEYDIDVVAICIDGGTTANSALDDLEARFRADGRFRDRVRRKKPCVRLEYAGDDVGTFHVDVVPARRTSATLAPLEAPRRGEGWHETAPAEYTQWCQQQGHLYLRTVKMLKRWRAEQQSVRTAIKSIVLQVLVASCMPQINDDATRIAETIRALHSRFRDLAHPPAIQNPVLPSENLAASWSQESFDSFKRDLAEAKEWADLALAADDRIEAADIWRELFGDDFPSSTPDELGFQLGDFSHAETPAERGWSETPNPQYSVEVKATVQRGKRDQSRRAYQSNDSVLFGGHRLHFKMRITAPNHAEVWWQVANTGGHARAQSGLRGEIFKGRDLKGNQLSDQTENWESTAYTGSHLIRALLVRNGSVISKSAWFRVNIYAKGRAFRL
jgi:Adenylyl/Guanylyl and SMODS C-terminal sensor domain/Second Messenger Oligonucleotide or Dinucleotide Synthetase domain